MWARLATLVEGAASNDLACRIAVPFADLLVLIGDEVPTDHLARFSTWDEPHTLLADDEELARRVRALGIPLAAPIAPYAIRQWDEREVLDAALHRFHDHDERPWGMSAFDPRVGIVLAIGAATVRPLLARLVHEVAPSGVVIDARDPRDLRVFVLDAIERGRVIAVADDSTLDLRNDDELDRLIASLCTA